MNLFRHLFLSFTLLCPLSADTVFTIPQGYTQIPIPAAVSPSQPSLTAISATLLNETVFSGSATVGAFNPDPDADPSTPDAAQTVSSSTASWTAGQFTTVPHLAYLINSSGAEEAFLITSHTTNSLTLDVSFNLLADSRFGTNTSIKIRPANTVGSILGTSATPFTTRDRAFIWNGEGWQTLIAANGQWFFVGGAGLATNAVVFPEEGIFIQRAETSDATLTLFGEVPSVNQASSVAGASEHFVSTRFPVANSSGGGIRLADLNIDEIPGWNSTDRAYFWTGSEWQTLISVGANWLFVGGANSSSSANDLLVSPNSALFLSRSTQGTDSASPLEVPLPYTVQQSQ